MSAMTDDDLGKLSGDELAGLLVAVSAEVGRRAAVELARLVTEAVTGELAEELELNGEQPVRAVFGVFDYDNGWFYDEGQVSVVLSDRDTIEADLTEARAANRIHELLADLSASDAVGPRSTLTLDLTSSDIEFDTYGNV